VALASYYVIYRDRTQDVRAFLRYRPLDAAAIAMLVVFGIGVNFVIALLLTLMKSLPFLEPMFESYEALSEVIMEGNFAVTLLSVGIIGPIAEEVMFRGLIFGELRKIMPIKVALVVQAVLFGAYHLQPVQGAYAAVIGVLLGLVYYRSGSILAPVIVHIAVNSFSIISSTLMPDTENYAGAGLIVIAGLLFFVLSSAYILVSRNFKYVIDDSLYRMSRRKPCSPDQTARNQ
jgi:membrane protease YdiL (CAAX protease family)